MLLAPDVDVLLSPDLAPIDAAVVELGRAFLAHRYEPGPCADAAESLLERGVVSPAFVDPCAVRKGEMALTGGALFPAVEDWRLALARGEGGAELDLTLGPGAIGAVMDVLRLLTRSKGTLASASRLGDDERALLAPFLGAARARQPAAVVRAGEPGLYRREHASLLVQSREARVLVDPAALFRARALPPSRARLAPIEGGLDAVLVTHGHDDHYHLASLFREIEQSTIPVVVPDVGARNLLNRSVFAEELAHAGQTTIVARWGTELRFGDILVEVLPFHGEQPTRDPPAALEGLRSWGNCYVIRTPELSVLVLVDSGTDPTGAMPEVVERSVARHGPIDVVTSCLRTFDSPFFGGLEHYWAALPMARLRDLYLQYERGMLPATTLGPEGAAHVAGVAGARHFLPYAHGFDGAGRAIEDIGWGGGDMSEADVVARFREAAARASITVDARAWVPGDVATIEDGQLVVRPYDHGR